MLGCCWKEGHTVYLPKDYEFKHSIPDFFSDFVQIKSSESHSFCWHLLNACPAWNTSSDFLGLQHMNRGDIKWHHTLLWPCFAKSLFCYCLFFAKQAVEKNHIKCLTRHLTWDIFPHSPWLSNPQDYGREGQNYMEIYSLLGTSHPLEDFQGWTPGSWRSFAT